MFLLLSTDLFHHFPSFSISLIFRINFKERGDEFLRKPVSSSFDSAPMTLSEFFLIESIHFVDLLNLFFSYLSVLFLAACKYFFLFNYYGLHINYKLLRKYIGSKTLINIP